MAATNRFYNGFDTASLPARATRDYRSPFQIDRDRILHSSAFRRLQSKTQVFHPGEYDFYRTRLTHSLETAQIGRSICARLLARGEPLAPDFFIDADLVEAVCLAHDIGHPPYGHAGERTLHALMLPHGGFEGNAQTLRVLTELFFAGPGARGGMKPTRALLDGVLKYKALFGDFKEPQSHFLYEEQAAIRDFVMGAGPGSDLRGPEAWNAFRSVECRIMDWADDTAYSLMDLVDGVAAGFIHLKAVEDWAAGRALSPAAASQVGGLLAAIRTGTVERVFARKIGEFIAAARLEAADGPLAAETNRHAFRLAIDGDVEAECAVYKELALDLIFRNPRIQQLEFKARAILQTLFGAFLDNYAGGKPRMRLLPEPSERMVLEETTERGRARAVCDYLAGMTDGFAARTYRRLCDPGYGSIFDLS